MKTLLLFTTLFFSTFVLEDATAYWGGTLVYMEVLPFWVAYLAVGGGIFVGDMLLYTLGRYGENVKFLGLILAKIHKGIEGHTLYHWLSNFVNKNFIFSIVVSRFVPGLRLPLYYLSGRNSKSIALFSVLCFLLVSIWTYGLFTGLSLLKTKFAFISSFSVYQIFIIVFLFFLVVLKIFTILVYSFLDKAYLYKILSLRYYEFWNPNFFYIPVVFYYFYFLIRYWLPPNSISCVNPCFKYGGMSFDSKYDMLSKFKSFDRYITKTVFISPLVNKDEIDIEKIMKEKGLNFPLIAKPDKGHRGYGIKKVSNLKELNDYFENTKEAIIIQEFIEYPYEYGIFWLQIPGEQGTIASITRKSIPLIFGDGLHTLRELILKDKRARFIASVYFARHLKHLDTILPKGEIFRLGIAGNHCQGAMFENGVGDLNEAVLNKITEISSSIEGFNFGRYDIKFKDIETEEGQTDFKIIEVNGSEAEMTHIYDRKHSVFYAYKILFYQWKMLFIIAKKNMKSGIKPISFFLFLKLYITFFFKTKLPKLSD